jgi:hypothetical protein
LAHHKRLVRYGDPLGGGTAKGEVRKWLDSVAIPFAGDDCLIFPFSRDAYGYGTMTCDGVSMTAHVYVLKRTKGPKPTPKHECCHSCGKGHDGCVNPHHLGWGTRKDNVADAVRHGTLRGGRPKGYFHPGFKLKRESRDEIYRLLDAGVMGKEIARQFGISRSYVSNLKRLRTA